MAKFDPINLQYAALKPGEKHLHSFAGQTCVWEAKQRYVIFGDTVGYFPMVPTVVTFYRGHITNQRWILELPPKPNPLVMGLIKLLCEVSGTRTGQLIGVIAEDAVNTGDEVERMVSHKKYFEIASADVETVMCYDSAIFWAVAKDDPIGMGIPFVPRYIDKHGEPASGSLFSGDEDVADFTSLVSSLFKLERTDEPVSV